jgi:hypothetical protein
MSLLEELSKPFPPEKISWRVGSINKEKTEGRALAYVDARDVMQRLDEVCGTGWQCRYMPIGSKTCCEIGIYLAEEGTVAWRADGAGDTDYEADKGAFSSSFKRASVKWSIARYLYDLKAPWVAIVARGRSFVIAKNEIAGLQKLLPGSTVDAAKPAPKNAKGVGEARKWAEEHKAALMDCTDADEFLGTLDDSKPRWVKIFSDYPGVWEGPENSGLRADVAKTASVFGVVDSFDTFIDLIEAAAADAQP